MSVNWRDAFTFALNNESPHSYLLYFGYLHLQNYKGQVKAKRSKGWAKPERELTPAEQRKKDRADKREQERQKYLGQPLVVCPFIFSFLWPKNMSAFAMLGGNLQALNGVRAEFKSYIWMEKQREDVVSLSCLE